MISWYLVTGVVDAVKEAPLSEEIDIKKEATAPFSLDQKVSSYTCFNKMKVSV